MRPRALKIYLGSLLVVVLALAAFAFRPTPLAGFDGDDLAISVNGGGPFTLTEGPCKRNGETWTCVVVDDEGSSSVTYEVEDPDWWGCWTAQQEVARHDPMHPPRTLDGCITLLDHA